MEHGRGNKRFATPMRALGTDRHVPAVPPMHPLFAERCPSTSPSQQRIAPGGGAVVGHAACRAARQRAAAALPPPPAACKRRGHHVDGQWVCCLRGRRWQWSPARPPPGVSGGGCGGGGWPWRHYGCRGGYGGGVPVPGHARRRRETTARRMAAAAAAAFGGGGGGGHTLIGRIKLNRAQAQRTASARM